MAIERKKKRRAKAVEPMIAVETGGGKKAKKVKSSFATPMPVAPKGAKAGGSKKALRKRVDGYDL